MDKGGYNQVSAANGWATLAQHMQRDATFGPLVAAVYACYLHPLEQDLPYGFRSAKAQVSSLRAIWQHDMAPQFAVIPQCVVCGVSVPWCHMFA